MIKFLEIEELVNEVFVKLGFFDIVVNNVGI